MIGENGNKGFERQEEEENNGFGVCGGEGTLV